MEHVSLRYSGRRFRNTTTSMVKLNLNRLELSYGLLKYAFVVIILLSYKINQEMKL